MTQLHAKHKMRGRITKRVCPCCDDLVNTKKRYYLSKESFRDEINHGIQESDFINDITDQCEYLYKYFPYDKINVRFNFIFGEYFVYLNNSTKRYRLDDIDDALAFGLWSDIDTDHMTIEQLLRIRDDFEAVDAENWYDVKYVPKTLRWQHNHNKH